jgi:hypothetical protein
MSSFATAVGVGLLGVLAGVPARAVIQRLAGPPVAAQAGRRWPGIEPAMGLLWFAVTLRLGAAGPPCGGWLRRAGCTPAIPPAHPHPPSGGRRMLAGRAWGGGIVRYRSLEVEVDGVRYRLRGEAGADGQVHVRVHRGGEPAGELAAPAEHLVALGRAVGEPTRAFGGRAWTVEAAREQHRAAYARWTEEEDARLAAEFAAGRTVEELAERFGRKPSAIVSRLRRLGLLG